MGGWMDGKAGLRIAYSNQKNGVWQRDFSKVNKKDNFRRAARGGFHKPIYALRQALTLCADLLHLKKLLKSWAQSVKWLCAKLLAFMKSTLGVIVVLTTACCSGGLRFKSQSERNFHKNFSFSVCLYHGNSSGYFKFQKHEDPIINEEDEDARAAKFNAVPLVIKAKGGTYGYFC